MPGELYIYFGEESFLIDQFIGRMKARLVDPALEAFSYQFLGEKASVDEIVNAIQSIPSFTPTRFVHLRDLFFLKKSRHSEEDETEENIEETASLTPEQEILLQQSFENIPEGVTVAITVYGSIDMRRRLAKKLKSVAKETQEFETFSRWDRDKVVGWIMVTAKEKGLEFKRDSAELLAEISGHSLDALHNELEKIITFAGDEKFISVEKIKQVASPGDLSYFDLGEALRHRDIKTVLSLVERMIRDGEPLPPLLGYIAAQVRQMLVVKESVGVAPAEIARVIKKHPYYVQKLQEDLTRYKLPELQNLYYELQKADYNIKSGALNPIVSIELALAGVLV